MADATARSTLPRRRGWRGRGAAAVLALATATATAAAPTDLLSADEVPDAQVQVQRSGAVFTVDLQLHAPVPPAQAWAVLTDFEHMPQFVPNLQSSQVQAEADGRLLVTQHGIARLGPLSVDVGSVREVELRPEHEIVAHAVSGDVKRSDSVMDLAPDGDGTRLHYHAVLESGRWYGVLISVARVQHQTAQQFSALLQEMRRRR